MTTAGKDLSSKTTVSGTSPLPSAATKSFDFSPDLTMPGPRLTSDQIRYCSEALQCFSAKKFNSPQSIRREFQILQAPSCTRKSNVSFSSVSSNGFKVEE